MSESENLEIYRCFIEEACSPSNLDRMDMFLAPGIGLPTVGEGGIQALKDMHRALRPAFPDLSARIEEISANGDWVGARLTWSGTHRGEFLGIAATGRGVSLTEIEIVRIEGGRIVELREVADLGALMAQISV